MSQRFSRILTKYRSLLQKEVRTFSDSNRLMSTTTVKMSRPKVLVTHPDVPAAGTDLLRDKCELIIWKSPVPIPRADLLEKIAGVDGIFCLLTDKIDDEVLKAAGSQLKVVASMSVGYDHLDLKALKARNINVGYTPGVLTHATAELTIGLLLATSRRLFEAHKAMLKGEWVSWSPTWMCGPSLSGSTVGIVGLGRIGTKVAQCLKAFDIGRFLYTSRKEKVEAASFGGEKVSIDELVRDSDFVIVTCALTPETKEMFNKEMFEKMKRTAIFINTSRGGVVDQEALVEALKTKTIRAAGLDVMTPEPLPLDSELLQLDNCVILPHLGSAATETREEMARITARNILAILQDRPSEMPARLEL